jgi:hypothetical protein
VRYQQSGLELLDERYAHFLDAKMTLLGTDPFCQVTDGEIRMSCSGLLVGHLSDLDKKLIGRIIGRPALVTFDSRENPVLVFMDCIDDGLNGETDTTVYLLPTIGSKSGKGRSNLDGSNHVQELVVSGILLRITGISPGQFRRIGSFEFYKNILVHEDEGRRDGGMS